MTRLKLIVQLGFILFLTQNQIFSQAAISGKVTDSNKQPIPDVIIEVLSKNKNKRVLTNQKGIFKIPKKLILSDTLSLIIFKHGFKTMQKKVRIYKNTSLNFTLLKDTVFLLDEVTVTASKTINKSNKTIYKINSRDYKINAKTDIALRTLPNVAITGEGIIIDNRKRALVFVDGIESNIEELKRMNLKNVNKIEVITNPSASYGSELLGGVIHIITKKKKEKYFKGEIEIFAGLRLNSRGTVPSVSFKTKHITFRSLYSYTTNNQNINTELKRVDNEILFNQNSFRKVNGWQDYLSAKIRIYLNSKSFLNFSGNLSRYNLESLTNGSYNDGLTQNNFNINGVEKLDKGFISVIHNYKFNKKSKLITKYKYFDYTYNDYHKYSNNNLINDISSGIKEHSAEIVYKKDDTKLFELPLEYSIGYKNILRKFIFNPTNFTLKQQISTIYIDSNIEFNENLSMFASLVYDISNNKSQNTKQYDYILPTFSWLYKFNNKTSMKFDYSRKLTRPSPENLNTDNIFFNPSFILRGNSDLKPQTRELFEIRLNKKFQKNSSISISAYGEKVSEGIIKTLFKENNRLITTFENAGKINSYGINLGINTKLFNSISVNFNSGVRYDYFSSDVAYSLVKENKGFSFNTNLYLYTLINKDISLSLIGSFNSHNYSLISKRKNNPMLSFEAEKSFFKNKLDVRLSYFDMFGLSTETSNDIVYNNFSQYSNTSNKMTNFTVSIIYNFGKYFNTRFSNPVINNNDIELK